MPISKHLANETGTVYRLLRQNIPRPQLELQHQLVRAAKLQQGPGPILGVVQNHVQDFHAVNSGTALHLLVQSTQEYRSNDGTTMSQMLQAVRAECPRLLNRILVDVEKKPRDLATAAWSLARLAVSHEETLAKLAREVEKAAGHFEGQDVANTMWAFTKLYVRHSRPLLGTLANVAMTHLKDYEPRHLVGAAWALATHGFYMRTTFGLQHVLHKKPEQNIGVHKTFPTSFGRMQRCGAKRHHLLSHLFLVQQPWDGTSSFLGNFRSQCGLL